MDFYKMDLIVGANGFLGKNINQNFNNQEFQFPRII